MEESPTLFKSCPTSSQIPLKKKASKMEREFQKKRQLMGKWKKKKKRRKNFIWYWYFHCHATIEKEKKKQNRNGDLWVSHHTHHHFFPNFISLFISPFTLFSIFHSPLLLLFLISHFASQYWWMQIFFFFLNGTICVISLWSNNPFWKEEKHTH